jgi:hypothetical protein
VLNILVSKPNTFVLVSKPNTFVPNKISNKTSSTSQKRGIKRTRQKVLHSLQFSLGMNRYDDPFTSGQKRCPDLQTPRYTQTINAARISASHFPQMHIGIRGRMLQGFNARPTVMPVYPSGCSISTGKEINLEDLQNEKS